MRFVGLGKPSRSRSVPGAYSSRRQASTLQLRYDELGEVHPIDGQHRKHQVETVRCTCYVPRFQLVGDVGWRSSQRRTGACIGNPARNLTDRQLLAGERLEPFEICPLAIVRRDVGQRRQRSVHWKGRQVHTAPARYQIDADLVWHEYSRNALLLRFGPRCRDDRQHAWQDFEVRGLTPEARRRALKSFR